MNIQTKSFSVVGLSWCSHRYHCSCLFSLQSPFSSAKQFSFSLKFHHGEEFTNLPCRCYVKSQVNYMDMVDYDKVLVHEVDQMIQQNGYPKKKLYIIILGILNKSWILV
ncbi:hypothetical protein HanRHA438_Chr11g0493731 [Helianthus annuus]|nr:hypothetical protein HanRHA438_Chr11g0493731 [Helianthus annuus]